MVNEFNAATSIRRANPNDIAALQATAHACWWATYQEILPTSFIESFLSRAYSRAQLWAQLTDPHTLFLVVTARQGTQQGLAQTADEVVIGFGQVGPPLPRPDSAPVAPADLHRLYLLPRWQRKGIGSRLVGELEAWLRQQGYPHYGAYVHERNEPAKHFYARQGFVHKAECDVQGEWYLVKTLTA